MTLPKNWWNYFVSLDVESMGLHGDAFAVGAVVFKDGKEIETLYARSKSLRVVRFDQEDWDWIAENVLPHLEDPTHDFVWEIEDTFWKFWDKHREQGAVLVADVGWPVEANFLTACIRSDVIDRKWKGPYPLIDVATALALVPSLKNREPLPDERPIHHPVRDARRSGRKLLEALTILGLFSPPEEDSTS